MVNLKTFETNKNFGRNMTRHSKLIKLSRSRGGGAGQGNHGLLHVGRTAYKPLDRGYSNLGFFWIGVTPSYSYG